MASDSKSVRSPSWSAGMCPFGLIFMYAGFRDSSMKLTGTFS